MRRTAQIILCVCLAVIAIDFVIEKGLWTESKFVRTIGLSLAGLAFASLLVVLLTEAPHSLPLKLIDNGVLRFFGKYSYGIYVIHGLFSPLLDRWVSPDWMLGACGTAVIAAPLVLISKTLISVAGALLSWRFVESPCLRLKRYFPA
jgi:peptidoglycan/LPS O-acetylase OafA/YrhL